MAEERHAGQETGAPDLLAALTAHGLRGPGSEVSSAPRLLRPRGWLARWLGPFARHEPSAHSLADLDDEWMGGSYARSRRLLELALRAHR